MSSMPRNMVPELMKLVPHATFHLRFDSEMSFNSSDWVNYIRDMIQFLLTLWSS